MKRLTHWIPGLRARWRGWLTSWMQAWRNLRGGISPGAAPAPADPAGVTLLPAAADPPAASEPAGLPPSLPLQGYATVVIPALNEAKRIAQVVAYALSDPATFEVIVIDDSSVDSTATLAREAGAKVLRSSMLGKGASMRDGIAPARRDLLVYLDGDLAGLRSGIITDLCRPLLSGEADFVKASFGRGGGRVTELTAKPMLKIFFPELAHFNQPLGGIIAARKSLLNALTFEDGYGVDIGLLIDAHTAGAQIAQVNVGSLEHDSQPLLDLTLMANEIGRVIFGRAKAAGRLHVDQVMAMQESQRLAASGIDYVLTRRKGRKRLLLMDVDHIMTDASYVQELARASGADPAPTRQFENWAACNPAWLARGGEVFKYVHQKKFEEVAAVETFDEILALLPNFEVVAAPEPEAVS